VARAIEHITTAARVGSKKPLGLPLDAGAGNRDRARRLMRTAEPTRSKAATPRTMLVSRGRTRSPNISLHRQALIPSAKAISARVDFSASLTSTQPKPRNTPSFEALAKLLAICSSQAL
jgi:hypothetical protein